MSDILRAVRDAITEHRIERIDEPTSLHIHPDDADEVARHYGEHWDRTAPATLYGIPLVPDRRETPGQPRAAGPEEKYRNRHDIPLPGTCSPDLGRHMEKLESPGSITSPRLNIAEWDLRPWGEQADPWTAGLRVRSVQRRVLQQSLYPEYGAWVWEAWEDPDGYVCPSWTLRWVATPGAWTRPEWNPTA